MNQKEEAIRKKITLINQSSTDISMFALNPFFISLNKIALNALVCCMNFNSIVANLLIYVIGSTFCSLQKHSQCH